MESRKFRNTKEVFSIFIKLVPLLNFCLLSLQISLSSMLCWVPAIAGMTTRGGLPFACLHINHVHENNHRFFLPNFCSLPLPFLNP